MKNKIFYGLAVIVVATIVFISIKQSAPEVKPIANNSMGQLNASYLLQQCPDEWIDNQMPSIFYTQWRKARDK